MSYTEKYNDDIIKRKISTEKARAEAKAKQKQ